MAIDPASSFPSGFDSLADPSASTLMNATDNEHHLLHQWANDAIENLQAKVGLDSSTVATSLDYLLKSSSSISPGHTHIAGEVSGMSEVIDDRVSVLLQEGTGIGLTYDDSANTLTIATSGTVTSVSTDSGSATPSSGVLTIAGGEGIDTSGASSTVTITGEDATTTNKGIASFATADFGVSSGAVSLNDAVVKSVVSDSGSATPSSHSFTITGGEGIDTSGASAAITITGEDATITNKGIASFNTTYFSVTTGAVSINDIYLKNNASDITTGSLTIEGGGLTIGKNGAGGVAATITLRDGADPGTTATLTYMKWADLEAVSGLVKCNGSGDYSAVTDNSTDWDNAYTHSQDNTQAHSDYFLNTGTDIAGAGAGFTWTFNASAGSDSVMTFGDGTINVSTGALQVGGSAVLTGNETVTLTGDVSGSGTTAITTTIGADKVHDSMIDWGTGASQVSAGDVPIADAGVIITATEVEGALQENRTALDLNTTHRSSDGTDHGYIDQDLQQSASPTFAGLALGGDLTIYEAVNNANPEIRIGSADAEEGHIQAAYDSGAQTLSHLLISTDSANKGHIALMPQANGHVGIGVTDPDIKLEIYSSGTQLKLSNNAVDYATLHAGTNGALNIVTVDNAGAAGHITLNPDGNVGIGGMPSKGKLEVVGNIAVGGSNNELRFYEGANYVGFEAPALAANKIWALPAVDSSGTQYLQSDGAGALSWSTPSGAGDVSKVGTPVDNQIGVWTGDGSIEGDADLLWDGSNFGGKLSGWVTAGDTWTYASADDPTYTFTITGDKTGKYSAGMKIKLTQTTVKCFIITKVVYSSPNTTITVYGGTDYDLADAAITSPYYSCMKTPHGFPLDPDKWTVEVTDTAARSQATPTVNTWYNLGSISIDIPIGVWQASYAVSVRANDTNNAWVRAEVTLSTANNTESASIWTTTSGTHDNASSAHRINRFPHKRERIINISTKDVYYINTRVTATGYADIYNHNDFDTLIIRATCAYL